MKALFELFRRFDARRIFGLIRRLGGMSRPKVKCYDLRSTHALRMEGDYHNVVFVGYDEKFLSTPSGWKATISVVYFSSHLKRFLSTPSGWKATRACRCSSLRRYNFYPRPPGGGRQIALIAPQICRLFLSTPSGWRATVSTYQATKSLLDFYPRPPGGGRRHHHGRNAKRDRKFLSTPSGWRATGGRGNAPAGQADFYPRPPGGGRRRGYAGNDSGNRDFYPRPPGGGRPTALSVSPDCIAISIHALRVEGDWKAYRPS